MRRDFSLHFAAWVLVGAPFVLLAGFLLKPAGTHLLQGYTPVEIFCYGFVLILTLGLAGAVIDVLIVPAIVDRLRRV